MAGDVDDVIGAAHHPDIAVGIDHAAIAGAVIAGKIGEIGGAEPLVVLPERRRRARRQGEADGEMAALVGTKRLALIVEHGKRPARRGPAARAWLERGEAEAAEAGGDRPAGLGLPPVIDDRAAEFFGGPLGGRRIAPLPGEEKRLEAAHVVGEPEFRLRVLLLDGAHGGRRGEQHLHPMLGDDPAKRPGIGRADRLSLIHHAGRADQERRIDDVGMPDHPADVGRGPKHVARGDPVDHAHRTGEGDRMPAIVAHHALGPTRGAGGVKDIERIGGGDRDRFGG